MEMSDIPSVSWKKGSVGEAGTGPLGKRWSGVTAANFLSLPDY